MTDDLGHTKGVSSRGLVFGRRGKGSPIVLLHGWCLCRRMWIYQEAALAASHQLFLPDLPGFGESGGLDGPFDFERNVSEVGTFLDEVVGEPAVLVGFAFGAAIAMGLAATRPEQVAGILAIGIPSAATAPYGRMPKSMQRDWPDFARRSARAICKTDLSDATFGWLEDMFAATPLPVALETVAFLGRFEPMPLAPRISAPTLFVHGELDDVVPVTVPRACMEQMVSARLEIVEGSGHLVVLDAKDRLTELIAFFAADPKSAVEPR